MRSWANKILVSVFVAVLLANVAAPGLLLHNCRQFGTKSTQLCACCVTEQATSGGCCSKKSETAAPAAHSETAIESSCCFTSIEAPFEFDGQNGSNGSSPAQNLPAPDADAFSAINGITVALSIANPQSEIRNRHSSDPPSYILTHSFRC